MHNKDIALLVGLTRRAVSKWRKRWGSQHQQWQQSDPDLRPKMHAKLVLGWLEQTKQRSTSILHQSGRCKTMNPSKHTRLQELHYILALLLTRCQDRPNAFPPTIAPITPSALRNLPI